MVAVREEVKKPGRPEGSTNKITNNLNIEMTYDEIAQVMGLTVKEVKAIEASALRKLRHPKFGRKLKNYINM